MILIGFLALIIVAILSQIVLFKGVNFLGMIEQKYRNGVATELSSAEELRNKILETSSNIVKGATVNSSEQVEVIGNVGSHLFYIENGCVKCELIKYGFRISRIGRFLAWMKIVPKMKMANEINMIFENLVGNKTNEAENEKIIKSISIKSILTNILAVISIILIISSVISVKSGYVDIVKNSVDEGYGVTYGEGFADNLDETIEAPKEDILSHSTPVLSGFYYVNIPGTDGQCFRIEWSAVEGATGYEIENNQISVDGAYRQIEETSNLFYEVSGSMEITASVKVRAYMDKEGGERIYSDWSEIKEAKINGGYLEENTTLNWDSMVGEYSDDNMNTIYLQKNGNDFYLVMATYRGGDDLEGGLFLEENGTLFYSNGGTRSFSLRIKGKDTIELFDDTWNSNLCGIYTKY